MKTAFIKFLPIAAAVLLATSCSKDDNDNAPATQSGRGGVETVTANTIPFSIRVNTGHSLKKVGYAESTNEEEKGWYNISFSDEDVDKLKMKIYIGEITNESNLFTTLTLKNATTGEFTGTVGPAPAVDADLTAVITTDGNSLVTSSDKSLQDLLATCAHTFLGTFKYGAAEVKLTDQNAYLAISMSPCCDHEIKINTTDYTVKDGRIWVAVPANDPVTSTGLGNDISKKAEEVSPGTIYTVARQYFSVADGKKVYFSKGNLQYNPKQNQWQFAPTQCSLIGYANTNISADYDGWTDLFGWVGTSSTVAGAAIYGVNTSTSSDDYGNEDGEALKSDWGKVFGENSNWYTLTREEFQYLFGSNVTRANKYGVAKVAGVNGLIILPDDWTDPKPDGKEFKSGVADGDGSGYFATKNTYLAEDWAKMEANGAVFLPAAGKREGTGVYDLGSDGRYWSSSARDEDDAFDLYFHSRNVQPGNPYDRYGGCSVRLVRTAL